MINSTLAPWPFPWRFCGRRHWACGRRALLLLRSRNVKAADIDRRLCVASLVRQCLRLSFMRSPGAISVAPVPFACPTVPCWRVRVAGLVCDAPGAVVVVESCISCPGLYCDAPGDAAVPLLFVVCATANEAVPRSNAVAMAIVFDILISLGWSPGGNR